MKKFSFAEEFNHIADVARLGDVDDVRICYSVFVGDPDNEDEDNFLGGEFFSCDDFTTWSDAAKAKQLVVTVLQKVDENLAQGLKLSDVCGEVLNNIDHAFTRTKKDDGILKREINRAVNQIFDYYISHEF